MDYFTKRPAAYPISDQEASTVAEALVQHWISRFGVPLQLHSDQGRETVKYSPSTKPGQQLYILSLRHGREEYVEKLQARTEEMHHLASERIGMASEKMKTRYDARATAHYFHEGDKVWLWNPKRRKGISPKLQTNWEGP
ncbi:retrovirus-related Pol polyprotein from transposon 412 [Trichonephila clavipes]|uniref:Retrovirus-related Pol polyprotein from transposon 412 n=1 Tax=Trichonephila clavipes TaxID=2585209 RepID=A0A8X6VDH8_TRICX|nr:retrovirus-related Pol polyprotein from transposon 412 [Trichonephila clavipes]